MRSKRVADATRNWLLVLVAAVAGVAASSLLVISSIAAHDYDSEQRIASTLDASSGLDAEPTVAPASLVALGCDDVTNLARASARLGFRLAPNTAGRIDDAVPAVAGPPNRINSARVLIREAKEAGPFHNFPGSFDDAIYNNGTRTVVPDYFNKSRPLMGNDSIQYRLPGSINGRSGTYEIFTRPSLSGRTEVVQHRFFRPDPL